jgi:hypothetical protein
MRPSKKAANPKRAREEEGAVIIDAAKRNRLKDAVSLLKRKQLQEVLLKLIEDDEVVEKVAELVPSDQPTLYAHCLVCHENFDKKNNTNNTDCKSMRHEFVFAGRDPNWKCPKCQSWGLASSCSVCNYCGVANCGTFGCDTIFCREGRHVSDMRGTKFSEGVKRALERVTQGCRFCSIASSEPGTGSVDG